MDIDAHYGTSHPKKCSNINLDKKTLRHTIQKHFIQKNVIQKKKKLEFFWITIRIGLILVAFVVVVMLCLLFFLGVVVCRWIVRLDWTHIYGFLVVGWVHVSGCPRVGCVPGYFPVDLYVGHPICVTNFAKFGSRDECPTCNECCCSVRS